jgi:hypothetical protein
MTKKIHIKIADITIAIKNNIQINDLEIRPAYRPFISNGNPHIRLQMRSGTPDICDEQKVFDSAPIWTLHRKGDTTAIKIYDQLEGQKLVLLFDPQMYTADLYFSETPNEFTNPFDSPALELLMINYLAQERGVIIHACGLDVDGSGILFVGESGAGKSTLSTLWHQANGAEIFSDDRIIVRKKDGDFLMYGTPWHGDAKFASPRGIKLEHIFFLHHDQTNAVRTLKGADQVTKFLKASFPPFWDSQGMEFTMDFFTDLATVVPCAELSFKPDKSVIAFIQKAQGAKPK